MANRRLPASALLAIAFALAGRVPAGATETAPDASVPMLIVRPLRDAGGLPAPDKGQPPLNERLTTGLVAFLRERAAKRVAIADARDRNEAKPAAKQPWLALEGDISRVAAAVPERDTYLLTARLLQEGVAGRIVAQWSGSARTLIYLTNNVRHDPRFSDSGLIGEMGGRIIETMNACGAVSAPEQRKTLDRLIQTMKSGEDLTAAAVPPTFKETDAPASTAALRSGEAYRLHIRTAFDGEVYVIGRPQEGPLLPLLVQRAGQSGQPIVAKQSSLLPANGDWKAPVVLKPASIDLLVLAREAHDRPPVRVPAEAVSAVGRAQITAGQQMTGMDVDPDVQVINAGNRFLPRETGSDEVSRLLTQIEGESGQRWHVARVQLKVAPAAARKVALLSVGIDKYPHIPGGNLAYCRRDAEQMGSFWRSQGASVTQLSDDAATRQGVLAAWGQALEQATPGGLAILHWSGHGSADQGTQWLVPSDGEVGKNETYVGFSDLLKPVVQSRVGGVVLVLDATGSALDSLKQQLFDVLSLTNSAPPVGVLAVKGNSVEDTDLKGGILTHALIAALRARVDGKKQAGFYELAEQVQKEARKLSGKVPDYTPLRALYGSDFLILSPPADHP